MIEIALSLAVIGFALIAIIGVLPIGMNVQRENREETVINHEASMLLEAIRGGAKGMDELTNYVMSITNVWADYNLKTRQPVGRPATNWFTPNNSSLGVDYALTNGLRIVGLLSTPKFYQFQNTFRSNFVVANVRSFSGAASEKMPQNDPDVRDMGLSYRLVSEVTMYGSPRTDVLTNNAWELDWADYPRFNSNTNSPEYLSRYEYALYAANMQNLNDIRLIFRWPLLPGGAVGNNRQVFRTQIGGSIVPYYDPPQRRVVPLFFIESSQIHNLVTTP